MATAKKAARKPSKKAPAKKSTKPKAKKRHYLTSLSITDIKEGDYFTCFTDGYFLGGRLHIESHRDLDDPDDNGEDFTVYLLNEYTGIFTKNEKGKTNYGFSRVFDMESDWRGDIELDRNGEEDDLTNFEIVTEAQYKEAKPLFGRYEIGEYSARKVGDTYVFGCGDVELSRKEVEEFAKVLTAIGQDNLDKLVDLQDIIRDHMSLGNISVKEVVALLKI